MWKGHLFSVEGIQKGYLFCQKWYIKGYKKGLNLDALPPPRVFVNSLMDFLLRILAYRASLGRWVDNSSKGLEASVGKFKAGVQRLSKADLRKIKSTKR